MPSSSIVQSSRYSNQGIQFSNQAFYDSNYSVNENDVPPKYEEIINEHRISLEPTQAQDTNQTISKPNYK